MKALATLLALLLPSCATLLRPTHDPLPIDSAPRGATVFCRGAPIGVTPCTAWVPNGVYEVVLHLDGHHDHTVQPGTMGRDALVILSLLMTGPIGLIVDAASGATRVIDDRPVLVEMVPMTSGAPAAWTRPEEPSSR
jgi:hypothetical protein